MKLTEENIARLKQLIRDGAVVLTECEDLQAGLSETISAIAKEMEIKPAIIKRLVKDVHKNKVNDRREDWETFDELYKSAGLG